MNYRLTENKKVFNGETLYQIECIEDCKYAKVGELGGYIASYDNLADGAWVNKDVCVCDTSIVKGYVENGFVAGNSIVEGKVNGIVIRNSFVNKDSDLECVVIVYSSIYNSKYKAIKKGDYYLTCAMITKSCLSDTELRGQIAISDSSISKSLVEWQDIEDMYIEEGYLMERYKSDNFDETGEVEKRRVSTEPITKANEDVKNFWLNYIESFNEKDVKSSCDQLVDGTRDILTSEEEAERYISEITDMEEYYIRYYGKELMVALKMNLGNHNDSMQADMIQKLDELGYQLSRLD